MVGPFPSPVILAFALGFATSCASIVLSSNGFLAEYPVDVFLPPLDVVNLVVVLVFTFDAVVLEKVGLELLAHTVSNVVHELQEFLVGCKSV